MSTMIWTKMKIPNSARRIGNLKVKLSAFKPEKGLALFRQGTLKTPNLSGYGDVWDATLAKRPCLGPFNHEHWHKFLYKERSLGTPFGLLSTINNELAYNLVRTKLMMDPSRMALTRRQIGQYMLSYLKHSFSLDNLDSSSRPTRGYFFGSTKQASGITLESLGLRFLRQDVDLRYAIPLRFANAAFSFGASGDRTSWSCGFKNKLSSSASSSSSLVDRCSMGGPSSLMRLNFGNNFGSTDLALNAFADLSYDLPYKFLSYAGIYGHTFLALESHTKLTDYQFSTFFLKNYFHSYRSYVGHGVIIPTRFFQLEANYCYILKQSKHDKGKSGLQLILSSPK